MLECWIDWNHLSDHEVLITFLSLNNTSALRMWSLDNSCLKVSEFRDYLRQQISFYLDLNEASAPSPSALCNSLQAFIKGQIILSTTRRREDLCWQYEIWKEKRRTFKGRIFWLELLLHSSSSDLGRTQWLEERNNMAPPNQKCREDFAGPPSRDSQNGIWFDSVQPTEPSAKGQPRSFQRPQAKWMPKRSSIWNRMKK